MSNHGSGGGGAFVLPPDRAARRRRAIGRLAGVGSCAAAVVAAACALRLTAADTLPPAGGQPPAERRPAAGRGDVVRVDPVEGWGGVAWASDLNTSATRVDTSGTYPRYTVDEPGKRGVWLKQLDPPVDPARHPILVLRYRAGNVAPTRYAIWLDDGTGPNNGKGVWAIDSGELVADGQVHEVRRDLRQPGRPGLPTAGRFGEVALGVSAQPGGPGWLELVDLRFEAPGTPSAALWDADAETPRWEYATLAYSDGSYGWEAGGTRLPSADGAYGPLGDLIKGLGGRVRPGRQEPSLVEVLDLVGRDGWEMVGIDASADRRMHVFKRRAK